MFGTCRVCGEMGSDLIKYSTRHYAHAGCGLDKWGEAFFDRLRPHQLKNFPYMRAKERGLLAALELRANKAG